MRVVRAVHAAFPDLTFDCTVKVEHILAHEQLWPDLAEAGCLFVVSAFESVDDETLRILDKGHTAADAGAGGRLLRRHGIEIRPSWLPFTPWTTAADVLAMLDFVVAHDLVANVDAVQYTIRLLLPEGSLLLSAPEVKSRLLHYDASRLSWLWTAEEPDLDDLQKELAALVEAAASGDPPAGGEDTFAAIDSRVRVCAAKRGPRGAPAGPQLGSLSAGPAGPRPRLSEPWFCCSEPTMTQHESVSMAGVSQRALRSLGVIAKKFRTCLSSRLRLVAIIDGGKFATQFVCPGGPLTPPQPDRMLRRRRRRRRWRRRRRRRPGAGDQGPGGRRCGPRPSWDTMSRWGRGEFDAADLPA